MLSFSSQHFVGLLLAGNRT